MEAPKIKVLSLSKKIVKQMERHGDLSRIEYDMITRSPSSILGWVWSEDVEWTSGRSKTIVVKFDELNYKLVPYYDTFSKFNPRQIFLV